MSIKVTSDGGVTKEIIREGSGPQPQRGQKVRVHYVGTFPDGRKFDSSRDRNSPFEFVVGKGVIAGWSAVLPTMKVGEVAKVTILGDYAYGPRGYPGLIPPNQTLIFEIEFIAIL